MTNLHPLPLVSPDVSRETLADLERFKDLVIRWNRTINLVSKAQEAELWDRHILDSLQILPLIPHSATRLADFGSGGGFPGMVLAIASRRERPALSVTLVESDARKSAFLQAVQRELDLPVKIICDRIEGVGPLKADIITARALAPMSELLRLAKDHIQPDGLCLFLKGRRYKDEINLARKSWKFDVCCYASQTSNESAILEVKHFHAV